MSSSPVVAHVSPNGDLGKSVLPIFVKAVQDGDFAGLHLITSNESDGTREAVATVPGKIKTFPLVYTDKIALATALKGVDVLVSTIAGRSGYGKEAEAAQAIIEVAAASGVKVYFNSDFGADYDLDTFDGDLWTAKKAHRAAAEKLGLKTIAFAVGSFGSFLLTPFFGVEGDTWSIIGDGNSPFAFTDTGDIGRYSLRAVILAFKDPSSVPSRLRVYSGLKTWNEYADIAEKLTSRHITRVYTSSEEAFIRYRSGKESPHYALRAVIGSKAYDFSDSTDNELLNPGEKYFKPVSFEEVVKATYKL